MFAALFYLIALVLVALVCGCAALRLSLPKLPSTFTVAFFHPYWCVYHADRGVTRTL
jgi:hypothetical protein